MVISRSTHGPRYVNKVASWSRLHRLPETKNLYSADGTECAVHMSKSVFLTEVHRGGIQDDCNSFIHGPIPVISPAEISIVRSLDFGNCLAMMPSSCQLNREQSDVKVYIDYDMVRPNDVGVDTFLRATVDYDNSNIFRLEEGRMKYGARNAINAKVKSIKKGDIMSLVKFDVTAPAEMASVLTTESPKKLGLKIGDEIWL